MSKMYAEIKRIVDEDISSRVSQYDVIFEAVTNAIHANATLIECVFNSFDYPLKENEVELARKKVHTITVRDNGDGLNDGNYDSFCKYRTEFKKTLGCKGVGRFVFLKVYNSACYTSELIREQEIRKFHFDFDFDAENISKTPKEIKSNLTTITLSSLSENYFNHDKNVDRRIEMDLEVIREKVLINLIPTLFFYKKRGIEITLSFIDQTTSDEVRIGPGDIPSFVERNFIGAFAKPNFARRFI